MCVGTAFGFMKTQLSVKAKIHAYTANQDPPWNGWLHFTTFDIVFNLVDGKPPGSHQCSYVEAAQHCKEAVIERHYKGGTPNMCNAQLYVARSAQ